VVCDIGNQLYVVEHTGIEPFNGLLRLNNQADQHFGPIIAAISAIVPNDEVYELCVPAKVLQGKKREEIQQIQGALMAWIAQTAPALPKRRYADYRETPPPANVPSVPFPVELIRFEGVIPGWNRLQIKHNVKGNPQERHEQREQRMRQACDTKFGKLAAWKRGAGA
jgi:hypothetical protein